jgi:hypothetical protein
MVNLQMTREEVENFAGRLHGWGETLPEIEQILLTMILTQAAGEADENLDLATPGGGFALPTASAFGTLVGQVVYLFPPEY